MFRAFLPERHPSGLVRVLPKLHCSRVRRIPARTSPAMRRKIFTRAGEAGANFSLVCAFVGRSRSTAPSVAPYYKQ